MSSNYRYGSGGKGGGYPQSEFLSDPYAREDPYSRQTKADSYQRDDRYSRMPKVDPYQREEPYSRPQKTDPYGRDDPYARSQPPSAMRYKSDFDGEDDSADERDTHPGSRGSSDYRERPDRPRTNGNAPTRPGRETMATNPSVLYELEHLATFTVSPKQGLVRPADGVKRLREMEASSGVWAMRVQLKLDRREIIILQNGSEKELECFAISRVSNPSYIASDIVVFTVQADAGPRMPSEMHLFRCIGNNGQDIVDDIEAAISGKFPRPPPVVRETRPRSMSPHSWDDNLSATSGFEDLGRPDVPSTRQNYNSPPQSNNRVPAPPSTQPKSNDDVTMLNHCFDDIESFVASLQQAANAQKELERRQMMNGGRDPAEETLRARSQPPPLTEFISTLQKFKLAFNLLPKLRSVLKDPDANQLLSMLFGPLGLVINASRDDRGAPVMAQKVDSPLLTSEACAMLETCLNQNESGLWRSLGPAWSTPSERWIGTPPPQYVPRFNDGWQHPSFSVSYASSSVPFSQPPSIPFQQVTSSSVPFSQPASIPFQQNGVYANPGSNGQIANAAYGNPYGQHQSPWQTYNNPQQGTAQGPSQGFQQTSPQGLPPTQLQDFQPAQAAVVPPQPQPQTLPPVTPNPNQQRHLDDLIRRGARVFIAAAAREGKNAKELSVNAGDVVEVLDNSKNWWKVKNYIDQVGFVPNTLLTPYSD